MFLLDSLYIIPWYLWRRRRSSEGQVNTEMFTRKLSCRWQPARRESMPKIAPVRRSYSVLAVNTGLSSFVWLLCPKSAKSREILWNSNLLSSRSSKVIDLGANQKRICTSLLATNSNFGRISYRFRDIDAFSSKIACFPRPSLFWRTITAECHMR